MFKTETGGKIKRIKTASTETLDLIIKETGLLLINAYL